MKVIAYSAFAQNVTHLPQEVIELIVTYIPFERSPLAAQRDLWACCLVSKGWYDATIKYLYEAPILSSRNFTEFARTLSPPVASRSRKIGLEDLVQHLDMGALAYESKKSTTSRLISRTKTSLRSFLAPAMTFSTTSLAPLSKCSSLQRLDLSRDVYDFDLSQLMRSIKGISTLTWLNLPKDCISFHSSVNFGLMSQQGMDFWPANLTNLQINEAYLLPTPTDWKAFLDSLPPNLDTLSFRNCETYDALDCISKAEAEAAQVTTLAIAVKCSDDTYSFSHLAQPFPKVTKMIVPGMTSWVLKNFIFMFGQQSLTMTATGQQSVLPPQHLEHLVLEESPDFPASDHIMIPDLKQFVEHCPTLLRIEVPEAYLNLDNDEDETRLDDLNDLLNKRVAGRCDDTLARISNDRAGIFTTERIPNSGVGLKRSFRYRGDR